MSNVRHSPWIGRHGFQDEIRQAFDRLLGESDTDPSTVVTSQWVPRVDIREEASRFVIFADIPGVDPKDIEIQMDKGILSIRGERSADAAEEGPRWARRERVHGVFHRRFALPDTTDANAISASGRNGVLEVVIPKRPETTPRRIQVQ